MIQQGAVAILGGLQLVEELGKLHDLVRGDLGVLRELPGFVAMVRDAVVRFGDADVRVAAVARLMTDHEGEHPADVALKRQVHQVVGHGHVIVERLGQPDGCLCRPGDRAKPRFHPVELLLHLTNVAEVLVEDGPVGRAQRAPQLRRFLRH